MSNGKGGFGFGSLKDLGSKISSKASELGADAKNLGSKVADGAGELKNKVVDKTEDLTESISDKIDSFKKEDSLKVFERDGLQHIQVKYVINKTEYYHKLTTANENVKIHDFCPVRRMLIGQVFNNVEGDYGIYAEEWCIDKGNTNLNSFDPDIEDKFQLDVVSTGSETVKKDK